MPDFTLEFEVYCGTCGEGLCNESNTRTSHRRSMPQVTVNACPVCIERKDDEIAALKSQLEDLQEQFNTIETTLNSLT